VSRGVEIVEQVASGASVQAWVDISLEKEQLGGLVPLGQSGVGDVMLVPAVATYEQRRGCWSWLGWGRVRVDFDQPVSVKEMVGSKQWGEEQVVQHVEFNRRKLARVTASQLVAFVMVSGYCKGRGVAEVVRGVEEVRAVLAERSVDVAFSGEGEDVVKWGVRMLGGKVRNGNVELGCDELELWREGRDVGHYFVPEAVVGTVVMGLVGHQLDWSRVGNKEGSITISQEKLMEKGELLLRLLGEDKRQVPPCGEVAGVLVEGLARAERWEGLGRVQGPRESQHGEGKWTRRVARQVDMDNDWQEDVDRFVDTQMVVGVSIAGREWLVWVAGLLRNRVRNLMYTTQVLHMVREQGVVRLEEMFMWVNEEVSRRRGKMWDVGVTTGEREFTEGSVEVLVSAGVLVVVKEAGVRWVSVAREFDTREMVEQVVKVIMEFKC